VVSSFSPQKIELVLAKKQNRAASRATFTLRAAAMIPLACIIDWHANRWFVSAYSVANTRNVRRPSGFYQHRTGHPDFIRGMKAVMPPLSLSKRWTRNSL